MDIDNILSKYIPILIAFCTACACLWHLSYWATFDINTFAYFDIGDVIKSFLYPFLVSCGFAMIGTIISSFIGNDKFHSFMRGKDSEAKAEAHKTQFQKIAKIIWLILLILSVIFGNEFNGAIKHSLLPTLLWLGGMVAII